MFSSWIPTPVPSIGKGCSSLLFFGFSSSRAKKYVFKWYKDRMASRFHQQMFWRAALKSEMIFPFLLRIIFVEIKRTRGASRSGLHKLWYPGIRDRSTWSKFRAHGEHGDVFLFSNLGALWFSENLIRYSLHVCLREVKNNLFSFKHSYLRHFSWRF